MRIVCTERFVAGHLCIGMVVLHQIVIDNQRKGTAHNLVIDDGHYLTLGEDVYQLLNLLAGPKNIAAVSVYARKRLRQLLIIFHLKITNQYFVDFY